MKYQNIVAEKYDKYLKITINRPAKLNALNRNTLQELGTCFKEFMHDQSIRAVILTGAGEKSFVAGADIGEIHEFDQESGQQFAAEGQSVFNIIEQYPKPVIGAINGYALGGGCELAMACHFRLASENAIFGQPEVGLGLIPGFGGTQRLARLVGKGRALQMLVTGKSVSADEALNYGLVNKVCKQEDLIAECEKIIKDITKKGPEAISLVIKAVNEGLDQTLSDGLNTESHYFGISCAGTEKREGTLAFLEKRQANF